MIRIGALATLLLGTLVAQPSTANGETKLLRFPDLHGETVVFCYAGDLWTASIEGGLARRLTTHPGLELFPKFSPDGSMIAFTGQYDGDEQVYVIPSTGGVPGRLTHYPANGPLPPRWGYDNQVYGWTPDSKSVLFRSMRDGWGLTDTQLFTVSLNGGLPEALPMPISGGGDLSPEGDQAVYSPLTRDFRTWKRYEGGWAQDLYIIDLDSLALTPVAHSTRTERDPMWIGDRIYFASDRSGTLNLYAYEISSGEVSAVTNEETWDVRWPSKAEDSRIIFELAGELRVVDLATSETSALSIEVPDDALPRRDERIDVSSDVENFGLSPKGNRALFVARGDIFSVPAENGPTRNLTKTPGAHERAAAWSPNGKHIAFISDKTGEEQVYIVAQDGREEPVQLTEEHKVRLDGLSWSPDSERIAYYDKDGKIYVVEVESKEVVEVADEADGQATDFTWSPDGHWLAFSLSDPNEFRSIYLWGLEDGQNHRVTDELFNEYEPVWDPKGEFLYYLSDRDYAPLIAHREWNYASNREVGVFALALRKGLPSPFPPQIDEVVIEAEDEPAEDEAEEDGEGTEEDSDDESGDSEEKDEGIEIDFEGLAERSLRVPVPADNYNNLQAVEGHLVMVKSSAFYYGRGPESPPSVLLFAIEDRKVTNLAPGTGSYSLSADGKKMLVASGGGYEILDVSPSGAGSGKSVSTAGLMLNRVADEEWAAIFDEVWRRYRDYFYVENMHGYDWEELREQYRPLLQHVGHRSDLNYVIGEMIAELNVGHAYIAGGDYEVPERPSVGLLGCRFELDEDAGRYKISQIFKGQNEESNYRSPLTEVGVDISVGDYIFSIDGEELTAERNPFELLRYKASLPIVLEVSNEPTAEDARLVTVTPIASEDDLLYLDWITENRVRVAEATSGRVGYVHIPNMGAEGLREFIKYFYPQIRKEGLVVDVRNNGGGNVSQMLIQRLNRELLGTRFSRTSDRPGTYPNTVFHGQLVCLIDANSASDGDIFPARFKKAGLGPLIGKRTWGGVVGITSHGPLLDGGTVFVPEFGTNDTDGSWIIEGYGVDPDIEVDNDPAAVIDGRDPQLERGIAEVLKAMENDPKTLPKRPADPVKTD